MLDDIRNELDDIETSVIRVYSRFFVGGKFEDCEPVNEAHRFRFW